jgi:16S rRNA (guanine527-N7)-methyltransferase
LGIDLSLQKKELFLFYLSLLLRWNRKINLTSIKDLNLIIRRHFLDSIAVAPYLGQAGRLMDVGSGAGFPGLPLKIVLPRKEVVLVEARRKKANFLRDITRRLNVEGMQIIERRLEDLEARKIGLFDEVVTRAFGHPDLFLKLSSTLLSPGGRSLIMHGPKGVELFPTLKKQSVAWRFTDARLEEFELPGGSEKRSLLIFAKG